MYDINVYLRYYRADCVCGGIQRNAALVMMRAVSDEGQLRYAVSVNYIPFNEPDDFSVTYDAVWEQTVFDRRGRRSKKREAALLETFERTCDELAASAEGRIFWDQPLTEARLG